MFIEVDGVPVPVTKLEEFGVTARQEGGSVVMVTTRPNSLALSIPGMLVIPLPGVEMRFEEGRISGVVYHTPPENPTRRALAERLFGPLPERCPGHSFSVSLVGTEHPLELEHLLDDEVEFDPEIVLEQC